MISPASESGTTDAGEETAAALPSRAWTAIRSVGAGIGRGAVRPRRIAIVAAIAFAALLAGVAVLTLVEHANYAGRVLPGVEVDGVAASGRNKVAVYDDVARLAVALEKSPLRVAVDGHVLSADPSLLDVSIDARSTAAAAIAAGRTGNPFSQVFGTLLRHVRPDRVHLRVAYDESRLEGVLDGWSADTQRGEVEGGLRFDGTTVVEVQPHIGTGILRDEARRRLQAMLAGPTRRVVTLPVGTIRPRVGRAAVAAAARRARQLLAGRITLVVAGKPLPVSPVQLASALGTRITGHRLDVTVDGARLHAALDPAWAFFESPPVDATFAVTAQNTVRVVPSRVGHRVDMAAVSQAILRGEHRIVATVQTIAPHRDTKWAKALGIVEQVSSFTTEYPPGEARVANIHRGADLLNNTVVEPGHIFSLNDTIGPRTAERGFVTAPVFAQGEFFDDYGGGVSQLATTTYNAGFFGGYKDVTHQPHTIYIDRYPAGREATVNYGAIDLQFENDTSHGVLIRTYYSDTSITVTLYGDNEGRTVHEENRTLTNPVPVTDKLITCPAPQSIDPNNVCATLSAGETARISNGDNGFDVAFDRVIDQPGHAQRREHYTWHYTMLPNQILVGSLPPTTPASAGTTAVSSTSAPRTASSGAAVSQRAPRP
ncbi:MAG TPA: VanW family protein [Acidimicrobiia bacterium]|jgi:vancomycin resistance protein YoaR|nr:VanW family protein [Acidimicrobiia bacterium]